MNSDEIKISWKKVWSGRFEKATDSLMERFNQSISFDIRLWEADIRMNIAWAKALKRIGIFVPGELKLALDGLHKIHNEFAKKEFNFSPHDEDIHTAIERRLTELIGPVGAKIHTGRSRNDQVVTDVRIFCKKAAENIISAIQILQKSLVTIAEKNLTCIMPGYTHLQQAQPVLFSHYLLSLFFALQRDAERLHDCLKRIDVLPLGSGALAGSAFPIDRQFLAKELGFSRISDNSIDAISDRDFILELVDSLAFIQIHLSRYCEDFINWSSEEFGFIEIDEAWSTGSSMMPQKKNPDSLELIRGKTAQLIGHQTQLHTLLKGLSLTYTKDLQEDKEALFNAFDTVADALTVFTGVISSMKIKPDVMRSKMNDALFATDIADYLVKKGLAFRESHRIVGELVKLSIESKCDLSMLPIETYKRLVPLFENDVYEIFDWEHSINLRNIDGGTGKDSVRRQIKIAKHILKK